MNFLSAVDMAFGSKDPLGLALELEVSDEELSTLDDDLRPDFVQGMECPVGACKGKNQYNSINISWKHWKRVHREKFHYLNVFRI